MDSAPEARYMTRMATMIDTLKAAHALEEAGFAKAQAESLATFVAEATSATREDLVTKDFLRGELAQLKGDLRAEIANQKSDLIRWVLASQAMLLAAVVALANFTKLL